MEEQPEKKQTPIEFVKAKLALNPEASFAEIKAQAKVEGVPVFPVVYGRAKALLGLVPTAPYGSKSKARNRPETGEAEESRLPFVQPAALPAPPRPSPSNGARTGRAKEAQARALEGAGDLEDTIARLKTAVLERDRYRALLERIAELIREELAG